jgi:Fe-S-cluster containining protein
MRCSDCGVCCHETEMLLTNEDTKRLEKTGHDPHEFLWVNRQGYARLRNRKGYCYFYDTEKRRCKAYELRPQGCRLYPVICTMEDTIILDELCPKRNTVTKNETETKGRQVLKVLKVIDREALERRRA